MTEISPPPTPEAPLPPAAPVSLWGRPAWYWFCGLVLAATAFWAYRVVMDLSMEEQRALVPVSTVWGMHACLVVGLSGLGCLLVPLGRWFGRRHLLTALGLATVGFSACGLAPLTNRIYYDEHIYMQIGQTITHTGRAEYSNYARAEYGEFTSFSAAPNKQPNGHPYWLSWVYRIAGVSEEVSHTAVRVLTGLTAGLLYLALVLAPWSLPPGTPVAVALAFAFTPVVLWWGRTVAVEPPAAASVVVAFFAVCLHARWRNQVTGDGAIASAAILAASAAFAAYFRPESLLVFPVVASLLLASDRRFLVDRTTWAALGLSLALLLPTLLHLWSMRTEKWGATDGRRFDLSFLDKNLRSNVGYFVSQEWFPVAGTALALTGVGWLAWRNRRIGLGLGLWFATSWGIFVLFYAGGYYYGASSRYSVVSAAPVALFVGIGAAAAFGWLRRRPALLSSVATLAGLNWAATMHFVPAVSREANQARADVSFVHEVAAELPAGSLIISTDPCIWNVCGRNAAQLSSVEGMLRTEMRELAHQYPGGIYLHWDYWMHAEQSFAQIWRDLVIDTRATMVNSRTAEDVKLALFRLDTPYACEVFGGQYKGDTTHIDPFLLAETVRNAGSQPPPAPPTAPASEPAVPPAPAP